MTAVFSYRFTAAATSSDARVAALYTKGQIRVTALDTGSEIAVYPALKAGSVLAVTADGSVVSVESDENTSTAKSAVVRVWKKGAATPLWEPPSTRQHLGSPCLRVGSLNPSADGSKLAIGDRETMILDTTALVDPTLLVKH